MTDDKGRKLKDAGPSTPVEIMGLAEVPQAGDLFYAVEDEKMARELAEQRKAEEKAAQAGKVQKVSLDDLFNQIQQGDVKELNLIVKADVMGSAEAVQASLEKLAKGRTTFTIAHRLTTIKNATKILVLTDKGIEEAGTHQELMKNLRK